MVLFMAGGHETRVQFPAARLKENVSGFTRADFPKKFVRVKGHEAPEHYRVPRKE